MLLVSPRYITYYLVISYVYIFMNVVCFSYAMLLPCLIRNLGVDDVRSLLRAVCVLPVRPYVVCGTCSARMRTYLLTVGRPFNALTAKCMWPLGAGYAAGRRGAGRNLHGLHMLQFP